MEKLELIFTLEYQLVHVEGDGVFFFYHDFYTHRSNTWLRQELPVDQN